MNAQQTPDPSCPFHSNAAPPEPLGITADCGRIQREALELAIAVLAADLGKGAEPLLTQVRQTRQDFREHRMAMEGQSGLFDYLQQEAAQLSNSIGSLGGEHHQIDECLGQLEQRLSVPGGCTGAAADEIRRLGDELAELVLRHRRSVDAAAQDVRSG